MTTEERNEQLEKLAIELRELLWDDASCVMQGAMVGCPIECIAFAKWWIQREKGFETGHDYCFENERGHRYVLTGNGFMPLRNDL